MQNQNTEKEFVEACTSTNPEQESYKNDSLVYYIDSNILKTFGAEESIERITEIIKADIEAFVQLIKGFLKPRNCDYVVASRNDSSKCGINPNYWTTFVRILKRMKFYQMVGC